MKNKKLISIVFLIAFSIIIIFLIKNNYIFSKKGNNISNKSADEIVNYILNIESYKATAKVIIKSNKNENIYLLSQVYNKKNNAYKQEILEPLNIAGTQFIYNESTLRIENTKLNLSKIYENYKYIGSNELGLISFVEQYKKNEKSKVSEEKGTIILETEVEGTSRYTVSKKLYINKEKGKIEKMEIKDITQNNRIYILYNEIEINTVQEEIFAFLIKTMKEDV